jgi:hypothetical protein
MSTVTIPQFQLPVTVTDSDLTTLQQDTPLELAQRVAVLCATPPGTVEGEPGFGLADQAFREGGPDLAEIQRQIDTYIPGADTLITEDPRLLNAALSIVGVQVQA